MAKQTSGQEREVLTVGKVSLVAQLSGNECIGCFFANFVECKEVSDLLGGCKPQKRADKQHVIFKQVH